MGVVVVGVCALAGFAAPAFAAAPVSSYVDTRIGTDEGAPDFGTGGGAGATYPGAVAPFGQVQFSPDTDPSVRNFAGGYTASDTKIKGFSLTHLSGAGCAGLIDVPILPTAHRIDGSPSVAGSFDVQPKYVSSFSHTGEVAKPGDYRVKLGSSGGTIDTALTAAQHAAAMQMTFPTGSDGSVLVNAGGSSMGNTSAALNVDPAHREITGTIGSGGFCYSLNRYKLHFAIRFDQAFAGSGTWQKTTLRPNTTSVSDVADPPLGDGIYNLQYKRLAGLPDSVPGDPTKGALAGAYATFGAGHRTVVARVAISTVSVANARKNLDADAKPSFSTMRTKAKRTWERKLGRIKVGGGTTSQRKMFYSALYHTMVMPNAISDANGQYLGLDGKVHTAKGFVKYSSISGWDTYRAQLPLEAMLDPKAAADLASSMVADEHDSGFMPKWDVMSGQANVMVGDPADLLMAGAWAFGARGFDVKDAVKAAVRGATKYGVSSNAGYVQRAGLGDYLKLGYVPFGLNTNASIQTLQPEKVWATTSTTLEYALADFGISQLAAASGNRAVCTDFTKRSANWTKVFDPKTGRMAARNADGSFVSAPATSDDGFAEGSAAQYTWFVPQDVAGLAAELGGRTAARKKLDVFFRKLNDGGKSTHAFLGNEPTLHTPYLYDWLGDPAAGAGVTRRALLGLYKPTPGGYPGNDDGGAMSAWYVFSALGLYPTVPGSGVLTLGSPLFTRAKVKLTHGTLSISAPKAKASRPYVKGATFGGKTLKRTWISWASIAHGKKLTFDLSSNKHQTWGTAKSAAPPSYSSAGRCR
jgi:predicted alpha-1,2-mannosidase